MCSVGEITCSLSPVASGPKPRRDGWVWMGEEGGVTLADSRMSPVSGQATCFPQPTGSVLSNIGLTGISMK